MTPNPIIRRRIIHTGGEAAAGYDTDAQNFFDGASITDETQKTAYNTFVVGSKADGFYSKLLCLYPIIGGTASQHSYNAIDTTKFQITWENAPTQSAAGVAYNGTTQYGKTGFIPNTDMAVDDNTIFLGVATNVTATGIDMGSRGGGRNIIMWAREGSQYLSQHTATLAIGTSDVKGFYIDTRRSNTDLEIYRDGTSIGTSGVANDVVMSHVDFALGCRNQDNTYAFFTAQTHNIYGMASGLTDTEAANLSARVATLQTELGR